MNNRFTQIPLSEFIYHSTTELKLSKRANNVLNKYGVLTVKQLCEKTDDELGKWKGCGCVTIWEIKQKLAEIGLCLGSKFPTSAAKKEN